MNQGVLDMSNDTVHYKDRFFPKWLITAVFAELEKIERLPNSLQA